MVATVRRRRSEEANLDSDDAPNATPAVAKHLGARVRLRRTRLGLSQQELADRVGLSWQQIQKYEHGVNRLAGSRLWDISCALNTPVDWFFEGLRHEGTDEVANKNSETQLLDGEAAQFVQAYWEIRDSKVRSRFRALMDTISGGTTPSS